MGPQQLACFITRSSQTRFEAGFVSVEYSYWVHKIALDNHQGQSKPFPPLYLILLESWVKENSDGWGITSVALGKLVYATPLEMIISGVRTWNVLLTGGFYTDIHV